MQTVTIGGRGFGLRLRDRATFSLLPFGAAVPPLLMVAACELWPSHAPVFQPGLSAVAFIGGRRTATTLWFYFDRRARRVFATDKLYDDAAPLHAIVFGLMMGWAMTHWLVDAGIWRMRDAKVRQYHSEAFGFLH